MILGYDWVRDSSVCLNTDILCLQVITNTTVRHSRRMGILFVPDTTPRMRTLYFVPIAKRCSRHVPTYNIAKGVIKTKKKKETLKCARMMRATNEYDSLRFLDMFHKVRV